MRTCNVLITLLAVGILSVPARGLDCEITCKNGYTDTVTMPDAAQCQFFCNDICENLESSAVFSCVYKGENVKGQCHAECKDGEMHDEPADSVAACQTTCNDFCAARDPASAVFSCFFKGENIKGQCHAVCKDETEFHQPEVDVPACRTTCNDLCDPHGGIASCFFKDVNIKGQCEGVCKDATEFHGWAWDVPSCQTGCNDFCDPDHDGVFSCFFKDVNVKGQCEAVCQDKSVHASAAADNDTCKTYCSTECSELGGVKTCDFKGTRVNYDIPAVSDWGLVVMALLVLSAATVVIRRHRQLHTAG